MPGIPGSGVAWVRFFIDGKLRHLARTAPYLFAQGRGNLLLPGTLGSGSHIFAVNVTLADGRHLTAAATAVVPATVRGIPRQVLGRWTRTVTAAEVARTQSFRNPADGIPLPAGTWQARIGADGVARYTGPAHDLTAGQVRFEPGRRLVVATNSRLPARIQRRYPPRHRRRRDLPLSIDGDALTVRVVSDPQCANRNSSGTAPSPISPRRTP